MYSTGVKYIELKVSQKSSKQKLLMSCSIAGSNRRWCLWPVPRPSEVTTLRSSCSSHLSPRLSPLASQPNSFLDFMFLF
ncbi:hypothetical protein ACN42_g4470 [Penicillium freii]|uniref:Uncharacterized protein n=1 Tax=Penicillium freii TaxID=48697 RepID=A0A101MLC4_PENFR|nr:hypothetical protein ACN42_g4470 [Penicillium freii]